MSSRGALDIRDTLSSDHQQESVELQPLGEPSSADVVGEPVDDVQKSSPWRLSLDADDSGTEADDERAVLPRPLPLPSPSTRAYGLLSSANDQHISSLHGAGGGATVGHLQPGYWNIPRRTKGRGRKDEGDMTPLELTEEGPCYTSPEVLRRLSENVSMTMIELATFGITVDVCQWEIMLARIPTWKFTRNSSRDKEKGGFLRNLDRKLCSSLCGSNARQSESSSESEFEARPFQSTLRRPSSSSSSPTSQQDVRPGSSSSAVEADDRRMSLLSQLTETTAFGSFNSMRLRRRSSGTTGGEHAESLPPTAAQARKWLYAAFVYLILSLIIVIPVRIYISRNAIDGAEPFGWVLGYMLGNISPLRLCVVAAGLLLVFRLSSIVETDTRRKVFHGMMVAMLLPTTFIDPAFVSLALAGVLSIFLLLELFRAAQLPPISIPLTNFIAPYVDGRDYRGPVVISHIFLLIGCAIPLWLSLASTPLSGSAPWAGWEVQYRDISMVSGVICVGMGDAAASLIGRRFGRRRWFFGGGKSIEGSIAFAVAVFVGLVLARIWLVLGGWDQGLPHGRQAAAILPLSSLSLDMNLYIITVIITKAVVAAAGASFTEAVLTGGNDNVVVPL
ncbi:hypothetical protein KEM55_008333, partial [Ascosphaera atra]